MKILFYSTKDFEQPYLETANKQNLEIVFIDEALSASSASKAKGFDCISIFAGDDASAEVLQILKNNGVKGIAIRAAGYDNVDIEKANELKIQVSNVPAYSPYAIAEHAVALILALNRKIITASKQLSKQDFTTGNLVGFDLHGKTVGIIGVGKTGEVFAKIMHGFGCKLLGFDIKENNALKEKYNLDYVDLAELFCKSDIISIHCSLNTNTKYLVNKTILELMKPSTMLINTSRGAIVNTLDVIQALENKQLAYFGTDVFENERGIFFYDHTGNELKDPLLIKLLSMPNVLVTPHQAFATADALTNIADTTFSNINCWNTNQQSPNDLTMVVKSANA